MGLPVGLRRDKGLVLAAVRQGGRALGGASKALRGNREVVLAVLRQNGLALEFASEAFRAHREVVLTAVRQTGLALQFLRLRADRKVVFAASPLSTWLRASSRRTGRLCLRPFDKTGSSSGFLCFVRIGAWCLWQCRGPGQLSSSLPVRSSVTGRFYLRLCGRTEVLFNSLRRRSKPTGRWF